MCRRAVELEAERRRRPRTGGRVGRDRGACNGFAGVVAPAVERCLSEHGWRQGNGRWPFDAYYVRLTLSSWGAVRIESWGRLSSG
jgi:hypothetical protein